MLTIVDDNFVLLTNFPIHGETNRFLSRETADDACRPLSKQYGAGKLICIHYILPLT